MGEVHTYKYSQKIGYQMFESLVKNNGFNTLILELGASNEYVIYNYLFKGKTKIKYVYFKYGIGDNLEDDYLPLARLYAQNNQGYDIMVRSLDIEKDLNYAIVCLWLILSENDSTSNEYLRNTKIGIENKVYITGKNKNLYQFTNDLIQRYNSDSASYKTGLLKNFNYYQRIIHGLKAKLIHDSLIKYDGHRAADLYREQYMYNNLRALYNQYPNRKFYGHFGLKHVINYQDLYLGRSDWYSLAEKLDTTYYGKVIRIGGYYLKKRKVKGLQDVTLYRPEDFKKIKKEFKGRFNIYKTQPNDLNNKLDYLIFCK